MTRSSCMHAHLAEDLRFLCKNRLLRVYLYVTRTYTFRFKILIICPTLIKGNFENIHFLSLELNVQFFTGVVFDKVSKRLLYNQDQLQLVKDNKKKSNKKYIK